MRKILTLFVMLMFSGILSFAQNRVVTGTVTDDKGVPIAGATVKVKGARTGTAADANGNFSISVPAGAILIFSGVDITSREVAIGSQSTLNIALARSGAELTEVVVTGVGVATDKRKVAISVESLNFEKQVSLPASASQALIGKIAGATISSASGSPGADVSILLRGINTLQGGTSPLIMVDGVEVSSTSLQSLDVSTIERVEVVQGAASATIYGAQGANGVIQVFTKKGKSGPTKIDISSSVSFDQPLNIGNLHQPFNHSFTTNSQGLILNTTGAILKPDPYNQWAETLWLNGTPVLLSMPTTNLIKAMYNIMII